MTAAAWLPGAAWVAAALAAALVLTLILAAWLTPRGWWRRPNLRALAVLGGGTLAFGALFMSLSGAPSTPAPSVPAAPMAAALPESGPASGAAYRVVDELNLRSERGVRGRRLAVLPAGTLVEATGTAQGDWWQVRAALDGRPVAGWASSLWLRRADEGRRAP